jgi:AmmeMemoRadiSam system protein A
MPESTFIQATELSLKQQKVLLKVAFKSIEYGLKNQSVMPVNTDNYEERLTVDGASFVTLHIGNQLRGCIGTLEAHQPLVMDVAEHAYAAAFKDPRFPPLNPTELKKLSISVSVLGEPQPLEFKDEQELIARIRPGVDGLILSDGMFRGTFLPSVWESLPEPAEFIRQLKRKAGLHEDHWSNTVKISRYTTQSFS